MKSTLRMPAEWEPHAATWIAWPHEDTDWPHKIATIHWVYAEIVRVLAEEERVEILCDNSALLETAQECLSLHRVPTERYRLHLQPNDRSWLRDSAPTGVLDSEQQLHWIRWHFNAWAKYENFHRDRQVPEAIAKISAAPLIAATRPDTGEGMVLEGGAIESDGEGTVLVTEECLLSEVQERNPSLGRTGYEQAFARWLGVTKTIWLDRGVAGDDTHGHIDDIARFVAPGKVVLAYEDSPDQEYHQASKENLRRLEEAIDARGRKLEVTLLPMPRVIEFGDERLPASYANFYIANKQVLVPTFNDPQDRKALEIMAQAFPDRKIIGIHSGDLILGQGSLHCLTQPEFKAG